METPPRPPLGPPEPPPLPEPLDPEVGVDADTLLAHMQRNLSRMHHYSQWKIGLAADPDGRQRQLDYPPFWRIWHASSAEHARRVYDYFVSQGMQSDGEHGKAPTYIYLH